MAASLRRLAKDHAALRHSLPPNYLFPEDDDETSLPDDLTQLLVLITGAEGTPYASGLWRLHLKMSDYPKLAPRATFKTRIYHPNVDESTGAVCLETLKRDWDPKLTLKDLLITISCLLIQPNPDSALNAAAGALIQEDYEAFARQARLMTSIHAPIPKHLSKDVQEAKRRGEEDETQDQDQSHTESNTHVGAAANTSKENSVAGESSTALGPASSNPETCISRVKRPLAELMSAPEDFETACNPTDSSTATNRIDSAHKDDAKEPLRKSPKYSQPSDLEPSKRTDLLTSTQHASSDLDIFPEDDKENVTRITGKPFAPLAAIPGHSAITPRSTLRKVSNVGNRGRGQPRVGIRRL